MRPRRFVTKKIIETVCRIYKGSKEKLRIGNISIKRDWGWAPEYVEAMHAILQNSESDDFVIATGKSITLKEFIQKAFEYFNLNFESYIKYDSDLFRPTDLTNSLADPSKAKIILNWQPKYFVEDVINMMIEDELSS